jgi:uncharacterized protein YdhG (YjbR/CyaY superfamily)
VAERKPAKKSARSAKGTAKKRNTFTAEERGAMKERAQELKAEASKADGERALLAKIAEMPPPDRALAKRIHALVKKSAPGLSPKTWYGMPAYAEDDKVVCFFQRGQVQLEVCDIRLQRQSEARRRRHVADLLRAQEVDRRRRGQDCRAREESGQELGVIGAALSSLDIELSAGSLRPQVVRYQEYRHRRI